MIPAFLLSKPALYWGALILALSAGSLWYRGKINDAKREAVLEQQMAITDSLTAANQTVRDSAAKVVEATREELQAVRIRADVARRATGAVQASYEALRRQINTSAPQPAGVPPGHVVVPIAFVLAADSAIRMLPILLEQAALERAASQLRIDALLAQHTADTIAIRLGVERAEQLVLALEAAKPSLMDRYGKPALVAGIVFGALKLLAGGN